jgi:hypothetical protein
MSFAPAYILTRFFFRLTDFFHHWYVHGLRYLLHQFIDFLSGLDQTFAVKINLRYLTQPLYKDYTIVGRVLGPIFRVLRVIVGGAVYLVLGAIFLAICIIWASIPILIMLYALREAVGL